MKANPASPNLISDSQTHEGDDHDWRWLWIAALAVAILLLPTLLYPFARDQAVFTYVGKTIAEGGMPYRNAWDLKPPGIYAAYAALWRLSAGDFFRMMTVTRVADILLACLTGVLLALLGRRLGNRWIGIAAAGWYAALYLQETYWGVVQAESWANPLVLLAILALPESDEKPHYLSVALAGILLGAVACLKPTALFSTFPFLLPLAAPRGRALRESLGVRVLILLAACGLITVGASILWLKAGGAWEAYVDIQRGFVAPYSRLHAPDLWKRVENVFGYTLGWSRDHWAPGALAIAGCVWARSLDNRPLLNRLMMALGCAWLGVCLQNKYFGYHWQPLLPLVALLAALGTAEVLARLHPLLDRRWTLIAPLAWAVTVAGGDIAAAGQRSVGLMSASEWNSRFGPPGKGDYSFEADRQVAEWLRNHSRLDDRVLVWGFEPAIYLMAGRKSSTRFFFNVPVAVEFAPSAWRQEFLRSLRENPPEWIIVARNDAIPWANGRSDDSAAQLRAWPDLNDVEANNYSLETEIEDFRIYRRSRTDDPNRSDQERSTNP